MEVYRNISKIFYFIVGFAMGVLVAICSLNFAHASENKYLEMYDTLPDREGWINLVLYDVCTDSYILYSLDAVDITVFNNELHFYNASEFSKGGEYIWDTNYNEWIAVSYSYPDFLELSDELYIVHSDIDIIDNLGELYFYKTSKIISNKIYQPVQTVLFQNILKSLNSLLSIGLVILGSMCGLFLIKKILDKFI